MSLLRATRDGCREHMNPEPEVSIPLTRLESTTMTPSSYLQSRGLPPAIASEWGLGIGDYADRWPMLRGRLTIPLWSYTRRLVSIAGRALLANSHPKYWNTSYPKERWLYGLWRERKTVPVIVEGYLDVWALALLGVAAYATMGASLSLTQAAHVAGMSEWVVIYPHRDQMGHEWMFTMEKLGVKVVYPYRPYPLDAPAKAEGAEEDADPHWLYVNARQHLMGQLQDCLMRARGSRGRELETLLGVLT